MHNSKPSMTCTRYGVVLNAGKQSVVLRYKLTVFVSYLHCSEKLVFNSDFNTCIINVQFNDAHRVKIEYSDGDFGFLRPRIPLNLNTVGRQGFVSLPAEMLQAIYAYFKKDGETTVYKSITHKCSFQMSKRQCYLLFFDAFSSTLLGLQACDGQQHGQRMPECWGKPNGMYHIC